MKIVRPLLWNNPMPSTFHPDALRAELQALDARQPLSAAAQAYQQYYGLDYSALGIRVTSYLGVFKAAGFDLVGQCWLPERPVGTLVMLHGFYDHMGLYRHVVAWAVAQGYAVLSFDLPGHGLSSGPRASIRSFAQYQVALDALFVEGRALDLPRPWHLLGQSTGGAIAIDHLLNHHQSSPVDGETVLLAPLVRPRAWGWSKLSYYALRPFVGGIARRFSENSNDPDFLPFLQADPLQPKRLPTAWVGALAQWIPVIESSMPSGRSPIVIQGEADMTVDWQYNLKVIEQKFSQPRILRIAEARHHLVNELEAIRARYFDYLGQCLGA